MPSTVIRAARHDPDSRTLDILFTTGRRYRSHRVPRAVAERVAAAFARGRYFNAHIRDRYDCTEVASAES